MRYALSFSAFILLFLTAGSARAGAERPEAPDELRVVGPHAYVYEQPDLKSAVVRRLYQGELVSAEQEVESLDGSRWILVKLGGEATGYVRKEKLGPPKTLPLDSWRPSHIVRDDRPFLIGARIAGETLGAGINFRYQPFTRLGFSLTAGAVIDPTSPKGAVGPSVSGGLYSALVLFNVSPVIEIGVSHSTYSNGTTSLELFNLYGSVGFEWVSDGGFFIHIYYVYERGLSMNLSLPLSAANGQPLQKPSFGFLDSWANVSATFNFFFPGITIGYAF